MDGLAVDESPLHAEADIRVDLEGRVKGRCPAREVEDAIIRKVHESALPQKLFAHAVHEGLRIHDLGIEVFERVQESKLVRPKLCETGLLILVKPMRGNP